MTAVTAARLAQLAPRIDPALAGQLAAALEAALPQFGVDSLLTRAHFLAQACYESGYFARFEENLNYTHAAVIAAVWPRLASRAADLVGKPQAIADAAYAGHNGNGDETSGDGWHYRGRGLFQLTGRANYRAAGAALAADLEAAPDQVAAPHFAVLTALWFWKNSGCNAHAGQDDCDAVTRAINGAKREGLSARQALTEQAKTIFI